MRWWHRPPLLEGDPDKGSGGGAPPKKDEPPPAPKKEDPPKKDELPEADDKDSKAKVKAEKDVADAFAEQSRRISALETAKKAGAVGAGTVLGIVVFAALLAVVLVGGCYAAWTHFVEE